MIRTKRLQLYPASKEQMEAAVAAETDAELKKAYGEMLAGCLEHPGAWAWYAAWMIERKDGAHAGDLCFKGPGENGVPEIGYGISEPYQGKGYATEAVAAALDWAFGHPQVTAVEAETEPGNAASQRVLEKCGFVPTGETGEEGPRFALPRAGYEASGRRVILETERLILRPWEETDAADLYEFAKDPAVGPAAGWPPHKDENESRLVIKTVLSGPEAYAVCLKTDGKAIGAIELMLNGHTRLARTGRECELGYWIGRPFWGRGLIPEAARALLARAFETLCMQTVWCGYYDGNEKSKRVQEKLGFRHVRSTEGVDVPLLHETRTEHINRLTKADRQAAQNAE